MRNKNRSASLIKTTINSFSDIKDVCQSMKIEDLKDLKFFAENTNFSKDFFNDSIIKQMKNLNGYINMVYGSDSKLITPE